MCKVSGGKSLLTKVYPDSDGCLCPDDMVIYECIVVGGETTVWKGIIVDNICQKSNHELRLSHARARYNSSEQTDITCQYGSISGRIISVENNTYISQLIVNLTYDTYSVTQNSIECIRDDGTKETSVGSTNITVGTDPSPPGNITWMMICPESNLVFNWSPVISDCPSVQYFIRTSNCGICPTVTMYNNITCTSAPTNSSGCAFYIQTLVCGNVGNDQQQSMHPELLGCPENKPKPIAAVASSATIIILLLVIIIVLASIILVHYKKGGGNFKSLLNSIWRPSQTELKVVTSLEQETDNDKNNGYNDLVTIKIFDNESNGMYGLEDSPYTGNKCKKQDTIEVPPNLDSILNELKYHVSLDWWQFGEALGVCKEAREQLVGYSEKDALVEVVDYWLKHHSGQSTWQEIDNAIMKVEANTVTSN